MPGKVNKSKDVQRLNFGCTALHQAVYRDSLEDVKLICQNRPKDINTTNEDGRTPLHLAVCYGRRDIVKYLLCDVRCRTNVQDNNGYTELHVAVEKGDEHLVSTLLRENVKHNIPDNLGRTPLLLSALYGYLSIMKLLLLKKGAKINEEDEEGKTALLMALCHGNTGVAGHLVASGCDVNVTDHHGTTALYLCVHSDVITDLQLARTLLQSGYDTSKDTAWLLAQEYPGLFWQDKDLYDTTVTIIHNQRNNTILKNAKKPKTDKVVKNHIKKLLRFAIQA